MQVPAIEARGLALQLAQATDLAATSDAVARLGQLAQWIQRGDDANGDGEIAPIPGEGGGLVGLRARPVYGRVWPVPAQNGQHSR
ncbi:MAG: hypothetical protein U0074_02730 [Kouleothrix sp.]